MFSPVSSLPKVPLSGTLTPTWKVLPRRHCLLPCCSVWSDILTEMTKPSGWCARDWSRLFWSDFPCPIIWVSSRMPAWPKSALQLRCLQQSVSVWTSVSSSGWTGKVQRQWANRFTDIVKRSTRTLSVLVRGIGFFIFQGDFVLYKVLPRMSSHCYKLFDLFSFDFSHKTVVLERRTLYCCESGKW